METQTLNCTSWLVKTFRLVAIFGFILCLGSIFSFIIMNIVFGNSTSIDSIYWQRLFVSKITFVLIIPGIILIIMGAFILSWKLYGFFSNKWITIVQSLVILIIINSTNITLLADKVTAIAIHQQQIMTTLPEYVILKNKEDMFGALNMIMLLACLIIGNYLPFDKKHALA
jgi:nitrogen fixation/metabolism regulation signal transduction histidine kinase